MEQLQIEAEVTREGVLVANLHGRISPGRHRVSIRLLDEATPKALPTIIPVAFSQKDLTTWRREDLYGDEGR